MRHLRNAVVAGLTLVVTASAATAQRSTNTGAGAAGPTWEVGTDVVGLSMGGDPSVTVFGLGSGTLRVGRFIRPNISVEPVVSLDWFSSDAFSGNTLDIELGVLYHLSPDASAQQIFIRPAFGMNRDSFESGGTTTTTTCNRVMVGGGIKRPSKKMPKVHFRGEVRFTNRLECDGAPAESFFGAMGGISVIMP